jgi:hypothetical protein
MTKQERAESLAVVAELWERYPHWRLGQLIANVAGWGDQEILDVEDPQLLEAARSHLAQPAPREPIGSGRTSGLS